MVESLALLRKQYRDIDWMVGRIHREKFKETKTLHLGYKSTTISQQKSPKAHEYDVGE